jgi:hypothetical protein
MDGDCVQNKLTAPLTTIKAQNHEGDIIDGLKLKFTGDGVA